MATRNVKKIEEYSSTCIFCKNSDRPTIKYDTLKYNVKNVVRITPTQLPLHVVYKQITVIWNSSELTTPIILHTYKPISLGPINPDTLLWLNLLFLTLLHVLRRAVKLCNITQNNVVNAVWRYIKSIVKSLVYILLKNY